LDNINSLDQIDLTIVIPVFNEEQNLAPLYKALLSTLEPMPERWEILFVDDASRDGSYKVLQNLHQQDKRVHVIRFRRNYGQTAAMSAGFDHARGQIVMTMDADMQNDPCDIPMLLATLCEGEYDIVSGWRIERQDTAFRRFPSQIANWLISRVTGIYLHDYGCSMKAYRSEVVKNTKLYGELHRFVPALASWMGVSIKEVPVHHHPRTAGKSKYNLTRTGRVLLDLLTVSFLINYSAKPMHIFGRWGIISTLVGFGLAIYLTILKLVTGAQLAQRPMLFLAIMLIIVGIQFISMGLLAELLIRIYFESQHKPIYMVRNILDEQIDEK
jgi:glycosyltransferase involved in cell wall biosynthesis